MESLIINKEKILEQLNNIISKLSNINKLNKDIYNNIYDITKSIKNDLELEDVEMVENIKEDNNHKESDKTLICKKSKLKPIHAEEPNKGYKDFYDINSRPDIYI